MLASSKKIVFSILLFGYLAGHSIGFAQNHALTATMPQVASISLLADLRSFQVNTANMVSSGLPTQQHFEVLKSMGVTRIVDLIPGDRTAEAKLMEELNLPYHNIPVDWDNPTVENFDQYVKLMNRYHKSADVTLTHCKLNWRGAVFTYLYRTTQLNESDESAMRDLIAIWPQPNEVWQTFIDVIKAKYS